MKAYFGVRALPVLAVAGLAIALAGCAQTTYGTGRSAGVQTITDFAKAASLTGEAPAPIDFAPRPPVVAPPSGAPLPTPGGAPADTSLAANWPNDPDAKAAALKTQITEANASGRAIKILPTGQPAAPTPIIDQDSRDNFKTTPEQIAEYRRLAALANGGTVDANGNPIRVYLSDPPPGYLRPDPNAPPATTAEEDSGARKRLLKWPWQWFRSN